MEHYTLIFWGSIIGSFVVAFTIIKILTRLGDKDNITEI